MNDNYEDGRRAGSVEGVAIVTPEDDNGDYIDGVIDALLARFREVLCSDQN